jgi:hypothetical protein
MISLQKRPLVDLRKDVDTAATAKGLYGQKAQVIFVVDRSGSMDDLYRNGQVQLVAERMLALGLQFDDDGKVQSFAFHNDAYALGDITQANYTTFIQDKVMRIPSAGTSYAPVMRQIVAAVSKANSGGIAGFFKKKVVDPTYVIFVTDGDNDDHSATEAIIRQAASLPIFWQFVGIGGASFNFLKKLDDLSGRVVDNADFFQFPNGRPATDAELFGALLNEFPAWIKAAKKAGIL